MNITTINMQNINERDIPFLITPNDYARTLYREYFKSQYQQYNLIDTIIRLDKDNSPELDGYLILLLVSRLPLPKSSEVIEILLRRLRSELYDELAIFLTTSLKLSQIIQTILKHKPEALLPILSYSNQSYRGKNIGIIISAMMNVDYTNGIATDGIITRLKSLFTIYSEKEV